MYPVARPRETRACLRRRWCSDAGRRTLPSVPLLDVSETYADIVTTVFSSVIAAKAWLATVVIVLALVQVVTAARMWGRLAFLPARGPVVARIHRWSGRIAILVSLLVFFQCVTVLGFQTPDLRVAVHSIAGTILYGIFVAKILILRDRRLPGWALPVAGGLVATTLAVIWLTSALWYFTNVRFGF